MKILVPQRMKILGEMDSLEQIEASTSGRERKRSASASAIAEHIAPNLGFKLSAGGAEIGQRLVRESRPA
jgi:hypothetical protein